MKTHIYTKYLTSDGTLDYQLLYADMAKIGGNQKQKKQEALHKAVIDWVDTQTTLGNRDRVTDSDIISILNSRSNRDFKLVSGKDKYKARDDEYLADLGVHSKDISVEYDKINDGVALAHVLGLEFIYIAYREVDNEYCITIFNCSKLVNDDYRFKWDWKPQPANRDIGPDVLFVGNLDPDVASIEYRGDLDVSDSCES